LLVNGVKRIDGPLGCRSAYWVAERLGVSVVFINRMCVCGAFEGVFRDRVTWAWWLPYPLRLASRVWPSRGVG
jgi:hypothetical protein